MVDDFATALSESDPLFACSLSSVVCSVSAALRFIPTWNATAAILQAAQRRCHEMDKDAAARGAQLLSCLAMRADGPALVQIAAEHTLEGLGQGTPMVTGSGAADGETAMGLALVALLEECVLSGGALQGAIGAACAAHAARDGAGYPKLLPSLHN